MSLCRQPRWCTTNDTASSQRNQSQNQPSRTTRNRLCTMVQSALPVSSRFQPQRQQSVHILQQVLSDALEVVSAVVTAEPPFVPLTAEQQHKQEVEEDALKTSTKTQKSSAVSSSSTGIMCTTAGVTRTSQNPGTEERVNLDFQFDEELDITRRGTDTLRTKYHKISGSYQRIDVEKNPDTITTRRIVLLPSGHDAFTSLIALAVQLQLMTVPPKDKKSPSIDEQQLQQPPPTPPTHHDIRFYPPGGNFGTKRLR